MNFAPSISVILFLTICFSNMAAFAAENKRQLAKNVITVVKQAEDYIKKHGKAKALQVFKKSHKNIFAIEFDGTILVSPIYPETVGTNQLNYKDPAGRLVVQEEINKAKAGGGWLKGRYRKNHQTGEYACRKLYILPMKDHYFIGSWYYYPAQNGICPM